ncbi:hypothetical protein ACFL1I_06670 [Candidatus Omnitrophota bacterium]
METSSQLLNSKGQSTLEYLIIWTVIVGGFFVAIEFYLRPALENTVAMASGKITAEVTELFFELGE